MDQARDSIQQATVNGNTIQALKCNNFK